MSQKINESGGLPAAMALLPAESPSTYALPSPIGSLSGALPSPEVRFVRPLTDHGEADRSFLLWCLAGLIVATVTCGAMAMSAVMMITSAVD